jgi:hypothetical protein
MPPLPRLDGSPPSTEGVCPGSVPPQAPQSSPPPLANAHRCEKDWFPTVTRTTVQGFPTREEALAAELEAIRSEAPVHNVKGKVTETRQTVDLYFRINRALRLPFKLAAILQHMTTGQILNQAILEMFPERGGTDPAAVAR